MAWSLSAVTVSRVSFNASGGQAATISVDYSGSDSAGNVRSGVYTRALTAAEVTDVDGVLGPIINGIATEFGLNVTIA